MKEDKCEVFEKEDRKWARKMAKGISKSSWSGDDRAIIQLMIYKQMKRIADKLEEGFKK